MRDDALRRRFYQRYGTTARVIRAPGRINLIGEHTDYNDGFVMPVAVDLCTWMAIAPRNDRTLVIHSENFSETVTVDLDEHQPQPHQHWSDYPRGVAIILQQTGYELRGADVLVGGEVPIGFGLGSSAAIEVATGAALLSVASLHVNRVKLAQLCQRAENTFVGMRCGIMDQFVSCVGRAGHALLLDCRSLEAHFIPLPADVKLVICNSMVRHALAESAYNQQRAQCEEGVRCLAAADPQISALRDVTLDQLEQGGPGMSAVVYRRCRHVISENSRVCQAADALMRRDLNALGRLMTASHQSLKSDYEVSCRELDVLVDLAQLQQGVCGSRMTGGGFGGCTINLVRMDAVSAFVHAMRDGYTRATGLTPDIYVCAAAGGVAVHPLENGD